MTSNPSWMPPRRVLWALALLAVVAIAYGLWWRFAAGVLERALTEFRARAQAQNAAAEWDSLKTSGFPLRLQAALKNPRYADTRSGLAWSAQALTIETLPWSVSHINFAVQGPQTLQLGPNTTISGEAKESALSLLFRADGMPKQLDIAAANVSAAIRSQGAPDIGVKGDALAFHWRIDPDDADPKDGRDYDAAINGTALFLDGVGLPFGPDIKDLKLVLTLRNVPALRQTEGAMDLVSWRTMGAPLTVRQLSFVSGGVDIQGAGDLRMGPDGMVEGRLDLTIGGLDKIVGVLSKRGAIPPEAKSTLLVTSAMLAATGAKVPMPLVFKDGKTFLGPVQIGPAPRIVN